MNRKYQTTIFIPLLATLVLAGLQSTGQPAAAAPRLAPGDWWAEYYANPTLSGPPVATRYDEAINYTWGTSNPGFGLPDDNFSIRWQRDEWFAGGTYRFKVLADDGVRVWVGDQQVIDEWRDRWAEPLLVDHYIPAGTHHVTIEYYEHVGDATMSIGWSRVVGGETWVGEYYNTRDFAGPKVLERADEAIDFDWGTGSPDPAVNPDNFSVRWTRTLDFEAGTYRFLASTDDGVRVWVDGGLVVDQWDDHTIYTTYTGDVTLAAGRHTVTVEYYEHEANASAHVWWYKQETFANWHAKYYDNRDLVGGPVLERNDAEISFDWGVAPPVDWMPDDNFSVRWTQTVTFDPGYYRFVVLADDGVRVWIDNRLLIDKWQEMDYELHYVDGTYLQGQHTVKVEYYEATGNARVRFWWERGTEDNAPPAYVPPAPGATAPVAGEEDDPWAAAYFPNDRLSGTPILTRIETEIDHDWGWGSPGPGLPKDYFSARWTQPLYFREGTWRFTTYTDDGVRVWIDDVLVIDAWRPMRGYRTANVRLSEGVHEVRVEYFEHTGIALARLTFQFASRR